MIIITVQVIIIGVQVFNNTHPTTVTCSEYQVGDTFKYNNVDYLVVGDDNSKSPIRQAIRTGKQLCTTHVTDMNNLFYGAFSFNQPIGNWDTSNVTDMSFMFYEDTSFNQPIGNWDTSNVTDMAAMFGTTRRCMDFNQPIGNWNTSNVTNMHAMFDGAVGFNQPIGNWDTSNVTDMSAMFSNAWSFNQPIGNWDTSNVTDMSAMFFLADSFNQPVGNWDTSNVKYMDNMFLEASSFNQPIGNWDTSNVIYMYGMFNGATVFNQNIVKWNVNKVVNYDGFSLNSALKPSNNPFIGDIPSGSYLKSCSKYRMIDNILTASCNDENGVAIPNSLNYKEICRIGSEVSNNDGVLTCPYSGLVPNGSYLFSCTNIELTKVSGTSLRPYSLTAKCLNGQQGLQQSQIYVDITDKVTNNHGVLDYQL